MACKIVLGIIGFFSAFLLIFSSVYVATEWLEDNMVVYNYITGSVIQASLTPFSANDVAMMIRMNMSREDGLGIPANERMLQVNLPSGDARIQTAFVHTAGIREELTTSIPTIVHRNMNDNFVGTLYIPALNILDSVFWTGDDFYLRRDYRGRVSQAGELYIDGRQTNNLLSPDILINGHNMNNGAKFGRLRNVLAHDHTIPMYMYIKEYPTNRIFVYRIFAAQIVSASATGVHFHFSNDFSRNFYYREWWRNSLINAPEPNFNNPIITLNTCDRTVNEGHLLVFAVMLKWV